VRHLKVIVFFEKLNFLQGIRSMLNSEQNDEVWLSHYLTPEDNVANYPPWADTTDDDSSTTAGYTKKLSLKQLLKLCKRNTAEKEPATCNQQPATRIPKPKPPNSPIFTNFPFQSHSLQI